MSEQKAAEENRQQDSASITNRTKPYLQFPLSALTLDLEFPELLTHISQYSITEMGLATLRKMDSAKRDHWQTLFDARSREGRLLPSGIGLAASNETILLALFIGTTSFGLPFPEMFEAYMESHRLVREQRDRIGNGCLVRLKFEIVQRVLNSRSLTDSQFRVLCAIYSKIGKDPSSKISYAELGYRAVGFASRRNMRRISPDAMPFATGKVRWAVDYLHRKKFFVKATALGRFAYYSHRLSEDELRKKVIEMLTAKATFKAEHSKKNANLTEEIKRKRNLPKPSPEEYDL